MNSPKMRDIKPISEAMMDETVITFDDWEQVLKARVPPDRYHAYREAIVKFRYWLRKTHKIPNVETFKLHLEWKQSSLDPDRFAIRQEALRWYSLEGRKRMTEEKASSPEKTVPGEKVRDQILHPRKKRSRPYHPLQEIIRRKPSARSANIAFTP